MSSKPFLSIVIPAYNEEGRIGKTLTKLQEYVADQNRSHEIIVVDDGSQDDTVVLVQKVAAGQNSFRLLKNDHNRGKGYAVRKGVLEARGQYIAFMDADLSTPVEEIERALHWLMNGYDMVIGSRALAESNVLVHQPAYREKGAQVFKHIYRAITGLYGIEDTQCGFKFFTRDVAHDIFSMQLVDGFMFDIEILLIAQKRGYRIKEMPVRWVNDPDSRLRLVRDTARMFRDLVAIRLNCRKLKTLWQ